MPLLRATIEAASRSISSANPDNGSKQSQGKSLQMHDAAVKRRVICKWPAFHLISVGAQDWMIYPDLPSGGRPPGACTPSCNDGTFGLNYTKQVRMKHGYTCQPQFRITQHERDLIVLNLTAICLTNLLIILLKNDLSHIVLPIGPAEPRLR